MVNLNKSFECVNCGYDLSGSAMIGLCPECGTSTEVSLLSDTLKTAPADYLLRVQLGARSLLWFWWAMTIGVALILLVRAGEIQLLGLAITRVLSVVLIGAYLFGSWMITTRQPGRFRAPVGNKARILVRAVIISGVALVLVELIDTQRHFQFEAAICTAVTAIIGHVAMCMYLRAMALRLRDEVLYRRAERLSWLSFGLLVNSGFLAIFSHLLMYLVMAGSVIWIVIEYDFLFRRFGKGLDRAIGAAARREAAELERGESDRARTVEGS